MAKNKKTTYGAQINGTDADNLFSGPVAGLKVNHYGGNDTAEVTFHTGSTNPFFYHGGKGTDLLSFAVEEESTGAAIVVDLEKGTFSLPLAAGTTKSKLKSVENVTYNTSIFAGTIATQMEVKILGSKANNTLNGGDAGAFLNGRAGHDVLSGGLGDDVIKGGGGSDFIRGNGGDDSLFGDGGNDVFLIDEASATKVNGGSGKDVLNIDLSYVSGDRLVVDFDAGEVTSENGGVSTMVLQSVKKVDRLNVLNDMDTEFLGNSRSNVVQTAGGDDELIGGKGNDSLSAGAGSDLLVGDKGNDILNGGTGADMFIGGKGKDVMDAGAADGARDEFRFASHKDMHKKAGKTDVIRSFEVGTDKVNLSYMDADVTDAGDFSAYAYATQATAHSVWFEQTTDGDTILWGDNNGDAVADWALVFEDTTGLSDSDLILSRGLS